MTKRDPLYIVRHFESLIKELRGGADEVKVPLSLALEILPLLKRAPRDRRGRPPDRSEHDREVDRVVVGRAKRHFDKLREDNKTREEALHDASTAAAETDSRPEGIALTYAAIRDRLAHPGKYRGA